MRDDRVDFETMSVSIIVYSSQAFRLCCMMNMGDTDIKKKTHEREMLNFIYENYVVSGVQGMQFLYIFSSFLPFFPLSSYIFFHLILIFFVLILFFLFILLLFLYYYCFPSYRWYISSSLLSSYTLCFLLPFAVIKTNGANE